MAIIGVAQSLLSDMMASRFELLLFAVSLIGYAVLCRSRSRKKGVSCKAAFALDISQEWSFFQGSAAIDAEKVEDPYPESVEEGSADVQSVISELLASHQFDKACDVFEANYATFFDIDIDEAMEQRLLMAALKCGRQSLADHLLQTSQSNVPKQVVTIQQWWREASVKKSESRVAHMHNVLDRMAQLFNELHPFEDDENSDGESTCALGEDMDADDVSDVDSDWDNSHLQ